MEYPPFILGPREVGCPYEDERSIVFEVEEYLPDQYVAPHCPADLGGDQRF